MAAKAQRALRYASAAALPERMRQMVEAQGQASAAPASNSMPSTPRKPRRDSEHNEQVVFFNRIRTLALNDPRYAAPAQRTFAIPNGGGRSKREAGRLKAEGVTAGVLDIFCSIAAGEQHGLYIEMKSLTGFASREQREFVSDSLQHGYAAVVCRGSDAAFAAWTAYLESWVLVCSARS